MSDQQKKWIAVGLVCVIIAAGYWYLLYRDQSKKAADYNKKISELQKKINAAKVQVAQLQVLQEKMKSLDVQLREASKYLPTSDEIEVLLKKIELAIRDSNLKILSFIPTSPEAGEDYSIKDIRLNLEGEFPDMLAFLDRISKFDRIVHPGAINMKLKKDMRSGVGKNFLLGITMRVSTYILGGEDKGEESQ